MYIGCAAVAGAQSLPRLVHCFFAPASCMTVVRRRFASWAVGAVHLGALQVFRLELVDRPLEAQPRLLLPAGVTDTAAATSALSEAAASGAAVLVRTSTLAKLLQHAATDEAQPHLGAGSCSRYLAIGSGQRRGDCDGDRGRDRDRDAEFEHRDRLSLALPGDGPRDLAKALAARSEPLGKLLREAARAAEPDWSATVARKLEDLPTPTQWQLDVFKAAGDGDAAGLQQLLRSSSRSELGSARLPPSGGSVLHLAAASGQLEAVQLLLRGGCSVHACAINGSTPLHWAAGGGHVGVVRALLAAGASGEARSSTWCATVRGTDSGQTAAHWAAAAGHAECLAVLLEAAPHALLLSDERQLTPAKVALREGFEGLTKALDQLEQEQVVCIRVYTEASAHRKIVFTKP